MIRLGFNGRYRTLHLTNEFSPTHSIIGGIATYMQEQYRHRSPDVGFLHYRYDLSFDMADYDTGRDIAIVTKDDQERLALLDFDILAVHYYDLLHMIRPELLERRKLVYVAHSVTTPEPMPRDHAFGHHYDVEEKVKTLCHYASAIVCVSHTEQAKLNQIFPEYAGKVHVIHNGLTMPSAIKAVPPVARQTRRTRLGFIGRMDYRKGLLELLKAIRHLDVELHLACDVAGKRELHLINEYIAATGIGAKLHWHGFCVGERKRAFFEHVDAVVVPSLYEPFCYTVIEPLACGKPVLVANNSGPREIVGDDYAYQFEPYSVDSIVEALERFRADSPERVVAETEKLLARMPLFDGRLMVEKYQAMLATL